MSLRLIVHEFIVNGSKGAATYGEPQYAQNVSRIREGLSALNVRIFKLCLLDPPFQSDRSLKEISENFPNIPFLREIMDIDCNIPKEQQVILNKIEPFKFNPFEKHFLDNVETEVNSDLDMIEIIQEDFSDSSHAPMATHADNSCQQSLEHIITNTCSKSIERFELEKDTSNGQHHFEENADILIHMMTEKEHQFISYYIFKSRDERLDDNNDLYNSDMENYMMDELRSQQTTDEENNIDELDSNATPKPTRTHAQPPLQDMIHSDKDLEENMDQELENTIHNIKTAAKDLPAGIFTQFNEMWDNNDEEKRNRSQKSLDSDIMPVNISNPVSDNRSDNLPVGKNNIANI